MPLARPGLGNRVIGCQKPSGAPGHLSARQLHLQLTRVGSLDTFLLPQGLITITTAMSLTLKQGSKGKQVELLQKFLNLKAKLPKPIGEDGDFGPTTKEAVKFFQKKAGLHYDGEVGPETAAALGKLVGSSAAAFVKAFGEA